MVSRQVQQLQKQLDSIGKTSTKGKLTVQVATLRVKMNALDKSHMALTNAIEQDAAKALQLPLMKRDVDNLRVANQAANLSIQQSIDRQYDLMKWLLGTFALGIIGLIATALTASRKGQEKTKDEPS